MALLLVMSLVSVLVLVLELALALALALASVLVLTLVLVLVLILVLVLVRALSCWASDAMQHDIQPRSLTNNLRKANYKILVVSKTIQRFTSIMNGFTLA